MTNVQAEWLEISPKLRAFSARPSGPGPFPLVLVFIEAFGVNEHFQSVAKRLASEGYFAVVPDLYHGKTYAYADFQNAIAHLKTLNDDEVMTETRATVTALRQRADVRSGKIGVVGFCMGGRYTFMANGSLADDIAVAIAFYGGGIAPVQDGLGRPPLLHLVPAMQAPLLLLYGSEDHSIQPDEHGRIAESLSAAQKRYTLTVFPEAGHGFFCDLRDSYAPGPAAEGWRLTLEQLTAHLGGDA